jgi:hypothetical protein
MANLTTVNASIGIATPIELVGRQSLLGQIQGVVIPIGTTFSRFVFLKETDLSDFF